MSKNKKKQPPQKQECTPLASKYLDLWMHLSSLTDEEPINETRREMSRVWEKMEDRDKRDFKRESDAIERAHPLPR